MSFSIASSSMSEYTKSPGLGLIMAKQGMVTFSWMTVRRPGEGVRPPSERAEQTSSLLAPPRAALKADSTLSTQTWRHSPSS